MTDVLNPYWGMLLGLGVIFGLVPILLSGFSLALHEIRGTSLVAWIEPETLTHFPLHLWYSIGLSASVAVFVLAARTEYSAVVMLWGVVIGGLSGILLAVFQRHLLDNFIHRSPLMAVVGAMCGGIGGIFWMSTSDMIPISTPSLFGLHAVAGGFVGLLMWGQIGDNVQQSDLKIFSQGGCSVLLFFIVSLVLPGAIGGIGISYSDIRMT